ncbi:MAG: hypothetical protein LAP87_26230 [Acidobacteriia bacterium]|nr:hypothetical protein [Terriglobia bacterium]
MLLTRVALGAFLAQAGAALASPAELGPAREIVQNRPSAITLRKRLHVNTLITAPDTFEIE